MMWSLDGRLAAAGFPPFQRDMRASMMVSHSLGYSGTNLSSGREPGLVPFGPRDTLVRVGEWYDAVYGARTHIDLSDLRMVVHIRRTPWRLDLPMVFGEVRFFADRRLERAGVKMGTADVAASLNIVTCLHGITTKLAESLSHYELIYLLEAAELGLSALPGFSELPGDDLAASALADYKLSVEALLGARIAAHARWLTARAAEKAIKAVLRSRDVAIPTRGPRGHDVAHLGGLLVSNGIAAVDRHTLECLNCPQKVAYGEVPTSQADALVGHQALLRLMRVLRGCTPKRPRARR